MQQGHWTILLPATLAIWALLQAHVTDGRGTVPRKQLIAGLVVAVLLLLALGYTAIGGVAMLLFDYL